MSFNELKSNFDVVGGGSKAPSDGFLTDKNKKQIIRIVPYLIDRSDDEFKCFVFLTEKMFENKKMNGFLEIEFNPNSLDFTFENTIKNFFSDELISKYFKISSEFFNKISFYSVFKYNENDKLYLYLLKLDSDDLIDGVDNEYDTIKLKKISLEDVFSRIRTFDSLALEYIILKKELF